MNPSTALATVIVDELTRCGLAEAVIAPGSRSAPLAMALWRHAQHGPGPGRARDATGDRPPRSALRVHVRIDERSAAFLALGLAKASRRPVAVVCTSGTAAAHLHAAVIEADEAGVPLLVLTADRPPELRGTGANQAVDQLKLYGGAVRWFCEVGVPEARPGMNAYWRSLAGRAWAAASGSAGTFPGPVQLNLALREPLVPDAPGLPAGSGGAAAPGGGGAAPGRGGAGPGGGGAAPGGGGVGPGGGGAGPGGEAAAASGRQGWPEALEGRPAGVPWTRVHAAAGTPAPVLDLPWTERGVIVCGDGCGDVSPLLELAGTAGWPVLAEPSSGARAGPMALSAYPYLLASPAFAARHRPDLIISAGRPGLSRAQLAYLKGPSPSGAPPRHVVLAQGPGRWADPARTATDVVGGVRLAGPGRAAAPARAGCHPPGTDWLRSWLAADAAARRAADEILDAGAHITEPGLARDLVAALPEGALLWAASSLPVRDLDQHMAPRAGVRVLASRGASGIDGLLSSAMGAALAHQRGGGGPAAALLGDLAFLHDAPGLFLGGAEPRPDLAVVVVNNDGGGIFSTLEQAAFTDLFDRVFGTPHGADLASLAATARIPVSVLEDAAALPAALAGDGLRVIEVRTSRAEGAVLRDRLRAAACAAAAAT